MKDFFKVRLAKHQKKMTRYMRYVLSDHFVLICFFLLGGVGYYYSNALKGLGQDFFWGKWIVFALWASLLFVGHFVTLLQPADEVFLLVKEDKMKDYLLSGFKYSMIFPTVLLAFGAGFFMPLLVAVDRQPLSYFGWYFLMLVLLKAGDLFIRGCSFFLVSPIRERALKFGLRVVMLAIIAVALWLSPIFAVVFSAIFALGCCLFFNRQFAEATLAWERMIEAEKKRVYMILRFIHLFTDVPGISTGVKRRKYMDSLLNKIPKTQNNTFLYLYAHRFVRGDEYGGLFLRLTGILLLISYFIAQFYFALALAVLFVYLIGFQMLPLYSQFDTMVLTKLYPIPEEQKKTALRQLFGWLLIVPAVLTVLVLGLRALTLVQTLILAVILLVEIFFFVRYYLPARLKKMDNSVYR